MAPAKYCSTPHVENGYYVCEDTGSKSKKVKTEHGHGHGHGHGHPGHGHEHTGHGHGHSGHGHHGRKRRDDGADRGQGHKHGNKNGHGHGHGHGNGHTHVVHHGLLKCSLRCHSGFRPSNGRWSARCDRNNGIWQIPATNCIQEVTRCMNVPEVNNGILKCEQPLSGGQAHGYGHAPHSHGGHNHGGHGHRTDGEDDNEEAAATTASPAAAAPTIPVPTAAVENLIGAYGSCALEPARNDVKGGALVCREAADGNTMCMIMCNEGFRPWHGELIIYCRDGVFYNRKNPLEIQKNMKCKEAPCNVEKYGIACFNHPQNRNRRDADFTDALQRSRRDAEEVGGDRHGGLHWHGPDSRRCNVKCMDGYYNEGSEMAVCNYRSGTWELTPGKCKKEEEEKTLGCVAPQDDIEYGKLKCKLTSDEDEMRGEGFVELSEEEAKEFAEWNTETMALVADRGMWELVPGFARKRRDTSAAWGMQLARYASEQYLVCWVTCKDGYEAKDAALNKIGCRMSDGKWLKPFKSGTHKW